MLWQQNKINIQEDSTRKDNHILAKSESKANKRYKREIWWLENKAKVKKTAIIVAVLSELLFATIGIWAFADYYIINYIEEKHLAETFTKGAEDLHIGVKSQTPISLELSPVSAISTGKESDLLTIVTNRNPNWIAKITYRYEYNEGGTQEKTAIIMQDTQMPITEFRVEDRRITAARLTIDKTEWFRIDSHQVPDPIAWKNERMNFGITEANHGTIEIADSKMGRTTFTIKNKSGYGYYDVNLYIILRRGGSITGVNRAILSTLEPLQEQEVQVNWFDSNPTATSVEIIPILNIFDESTYLDKGIDPGVDIRDILQKRR